MGCGLVPGLGKQLDLTSNQDDSVVRTEARIVKLNRAERNGAASTAAVVSWACWAHTGVCQSPEI